MPVRDLLSAASTQGGGPADPYFNYVPLLLNGDGTNGAQNNTFLDSSTNNFTITRNGNTTQGSFSPYGTLWSNYFSGSTSYLVTTATQIIPATGNFTLEGWVYPTSNNTYFFNQASSSSANRFNGGIDTNNTLFFSLGATFYNSTNAFVLNSWNHFAITRSGSTFTVFINGTLDSTQTNSMTIQNTVLKIGNYYSNNQGFNGYISNLRVNNTVVYTTSFTPSTTPLTAISGTQFLSCQSNRFIDNSSNNATITVGGTPSVQRFSPFNPTAPYSTSVIGGSGYFDGTSGTNLATTATQIIPATGDFTVEGWIYPNTTGPLLFSQATNSNAGRFQAYIDTNALYVIFGASGNNYRSTNKFTLNAWNYYAITRTGSTFTMYVNGILDGTYSSSMTINNEILRIGTYYSAGAEFNGYMSDFRVTNSNIYSSTFTLPTAPTSSSSANFLAHMTNAGIPDLAMQNNLETVGDAQVSTSVKKYGTGSLAFDGSGDALALPASVNLAFGTGDFTIEMWVYGAATSSTVGGSFTGLFALGTIATSGSFEIYFGTSSTAYVFTGTGGGTNLISFSTSTLLNSSWNHFAITRSGTSLKAFVNGSQVGSTATDSNNYSLAATTTSYFGSRAASAGNFTGYIDDLRITKGLARYTTTFTPPTSALPTY